MQFFWNIYIILRNFWVQSWHMSAATKALDICIRWIIYFNRLEPGWNWLSQVAKPGLTPYLGKPAIIAPAPWAPPWPCCTAALGQPGKRNYLRLCATKKIDFTLNYPQCNDCRNRKNIFWCKPPWSHVVVQVSICFGLPIYGPSCLSSPWTRKLTYCGRFRTERSIITGGNKLVC